MTAILNQQPVSNDKELLSLALYGFASFTSFYVIDNHVKGLALHIERLINDATALFGVAPSTECILANLKSFIANNKALNSFGARVTIFPADFSLARPGEVSSLNILVTGRSPSKPSEQPLALKPIAAIRTLPQHKTANMTANLMARAEAQRDGFDDALMIDDGIITEGPTWNVFFGQNKQLFTPSLDCGILPGVTRRLLLDCAIHSGLEVIERPIAVTELNSFDYGFVSNAMIGVQAIAKVGERSFDCDALPINALYQQYQALKSDHL